MFFNLQNQYYDYTLQFQVFLRRTPVESMCYIIIIHFLLVDYSVELKYKINSYVVEQIYGSLLALHGLIKNYYS